MWVNRPFWYTEHTVIIGNEWHLTHSEVNGMLGWHTQRNSEEGKMIQKVLYAVRSERVPKIFKQVAPAV